MYYAGLSANGSQNITSQVTDKPGIFVSTTVPYGSAPTVYAPAQTAHPGLAQRFAAVPQTYAVVSNGGPTGYTTMSPAYHSLPYSIQSIPSSTHAYISAAQYPGISYQTSLTPPRSAPPSPYSAPVQAGAPLFASGYSTITAGMQAPSGRSYTIGTMPGYPQAYAMPGTYHGVMNYGPHF